MNNSLDQLVKAGTRYIYLMMLRKIVGMLAVIASLYLAWQVIVKAGNVM